MHTVLDVETTYQIKNKKKDPSPFNPKNYLVSIGWKYETDINVNYVFFKHNDLPLLPKERIQNRKRQIQADLDNTTLLVGHHIKFDLMWLKECGFKYDGPVWCTMLAEYVLARGIKIPFSLKESCIRRKVSEKSDVLQKYLDDNIPVEEIPIEELEPYGIQDIDSTEELYLKQKELFELEENIGLKPTLKMMNEMLLVLIDMERVGIYINNTILYTIRDQYKKRLEDLNNKLQSQIGEVMGDTPINLDSPEQLSWVLFSRKPKSKHNWKEIFNIGSEIRGSTVKPKYRTYMAPNRFYNTVRNHTNPILKTKAIHCTDCVRGFIQKIKKDGKPFKNLTVCKTCNGLRFYYEPQKQLAGFKLKPLGYKFTTEGGFQSNTSSLTLLRQNAKKDTRIFIENLIERNKTDTLLNTHIAGIVNNVGEDNILHSQFMQITTATGRLSSINPNVHNHPRGDTSEIRKCICSRFPGGKIMKADQAQLEFRTAAEQSKCAAAIRDILNNVDIHTITKDTINAFDEEENITRQDAKNHCFPLYTEILTPNGWKKHNELKVGDAIINYNPKSKLLEEDMIIDYTLPHTQQVIRMKTKHNWCVDSTLEHRWYCDKRTDTGKTGRIYRSCVVLTKDIHSEHRILTSAKFKSNGNLSEDEAALLGWIFSDGTLRISPRTGRTAQGKLSERQFYGAVLIQKKYTEEIKKLLKQLKIKTHLRINKEKVHYWCLSSMDIRPIFHKANIYSNNINYEKLVLGFSSKARKAFLNAVCLAEGTIRHNNTWRIAQNSGSFCEAIKLAGFLCGYDIRTTKVISRTGKQHEQITLRTRPYVTGQRIVKENLGEQLVWCVTTNNKTVVIRQRDTISISGQTFKPLYGGSSGTPRERAYYKYFYVRYPGIKKWHNKLLNTAITKHRITIPTGRQYDFPGAKIIGNSGYINFQTNIKSYPNQGFATGDIVPCWAIELWKLVVNSEYNINSVIINEIHDELLLDVYPGEEALIAKLLQKSADRLPAIFIERYNYELIVPLEIEIKIGDNALELSDYA